MKRFTLLVGVLYVVFDVVRLLLELQHRRGGVDYGFITGMGLFMLVSSIMSFVLGHLAVRWLFHMLEKEWRPCAFYLWVLPLAAGFSSFLPW